MQVPDAWPNTFRQARFLSAVDFVQSDRLRRAVALEMQRVLSQVDLLLVPSLRDEMLTIGNFTGLPSLTLRAGFVRVGQARSDWAPDPAQPLPKFAPPRRVPHGVTLIGRLFDEVTVARVGLALERNLGGSGRKASRFLNSVSHSIIGGQGGIWVPPHRRRAAQSGRGASVHAGVACRPVRALTGAKFNWLRGRSGCYAIPRSPNYSYAP
jgi:hypothetical protein